MSNGGPSGRYMLAVCECEQRQSVPRDAAALTADAVAGTMEGAGRRRARPRLRGVVRRCANRRRVASVQITHVLVLRGRRVVARSRRQGADDRSDCTTYTPRDPHR
jgi:hypothetical protein